MTKATQLTTACERFTAACRVPNQILETSLQGAELRAALEPAYAERRAAEASLIALCDAMGLTPTNRTGSGKPTSERAFASRSVGHVIIYRDTSATFTAPAVGAKAARTNEIKARLERNRAAY